MRTYNIKASQIQREWHVVDVANKTLGRISTQIATWLMGKHKPTFSPNADMGDFVIVINAEKVHLTGRKKAEQKFYYRHSGYPGGLRAVSYNEMLETRPTMVIRHAVEGMLPHTRLGESMRKRLRVYAGDKYPETVKAKAVEAGKG